MATDESDVSEKSKNVITTSVLRKEESQKTSETDITVKEVITDITLSEKKITVFCFVLLVVLGMPKVIHMSNVRSEMYCR
jgi:hypothetical protein